MGVSPLVESLFGYEPTVVSERFQAVHRAGVRPVLNSSVHLHMKVRRMIPESLLRKLVGNERPEDSAGLEQELAIARAKGYRVPDVDLSSAVITVQQARSALSRLQIDENGLFGEIMLRFRAFPLGSGGELLSLDQILERSIRSNWGVDYPDFPERFLELSSGEGEGGFLYERSTGFVFDVDWNAMQELIAGELTPKWTSYGAFLEWYYDIDPT